MNDLNYKIKRILEEDIEIPNNYNLMIEKTLNNKKQLFKFGIKEKIAKFIVCTLAMVLGTGGICLAGVKVYNEYIKNQSTTESAGLYKTKDNITTYKYDLRSNEMEIVAGEEGIYYKVITNIEEYNKYKERVSDLQEMTKDDLKENFLLIVTWELPKRAYEKDCEIGAVTVNEDSTTIVLKQKENPNYEENSNILSAIISKEKLKDSVTLKIEKKPLNTRNFAKISDLPKDYSVLDAIKDGCFVIEKNILKSENKSQFDEFITKTKNGQNDFIRIYEKDIENRILIIDIEYKDNFYFCYKTNLRNNEKWFDSYKQIDKSYIQIGNEKMIFYGFSRIILNNEHSNNPIVIIRDIEN